jgi:hypothetical protein
MFTRTHLMTWISRDSKERFARMAQAQGLSESALLRRLVEFSLAATGAVETSSLKSVEPVATSGRISVRLRQDDLILLRERALARQLLTSTYVSYLVRSHLRAKAPLPTAELETLKRSVAEVGAIGRNIKQIARAVNQQQWPGGPTREVLQALIKVLIGLRDNFKLTFRASPA